MGRNQVCGLSEKLTAVDYVLLRLFE